MSVDLTSFLKRAVKVVYTDFDRGEASNKVARGTLDAADDDFLYITQPGRGPIAVGRKHIVTLQLENGGGDRL